MKIDFSIFKKHFMVLEFGFRKVKWGEVRGDAILKLDTCDINGEIGEEMISTLKLFLKHKRIKNNSVLISLPSRLATCRHVRFPSIEPKEIEQMAVWQASQILPFDSDEIIHNFEIIDFEPDGYANTMLYLISRQILNRYLKVIKAVGIKLLALTLSSQGLYFWYGDTGQQTIAVINLDSDFTDLIVISKDKLVFSRSFQFDSAMPEVFIQEIELSLQAYKREFKNTNIDKVVLTGIPDLLKMAEGILRNNLDLPLKIRDTLKNENLSFAAIMGFLKHREIPKINLLPNDVKQVLKLDSTYRQIKKSIVIFLSIIILALSVFVKDNYQKRIYLKNLSQQIKDIQPEARELEIFLKRTQLVNNRFKDTYPLVEILTSLAKLVPDQINLSSIVLREDHQVDGRGVSTDITHIFKMVDELNKSNYFQDVKISYAARRKGKDSEMTEFQITMPLRKK